MLCSLFGGVLIGGAVTIMLLFNGRTTGISGIIAAALAKPVEDYLWRWMFIGGLIVGGVFLNFMRPDFFINASGRGLGTTLIAGLLVGYGTSLGSGCTSGHGVCGLSRFSIRSMVATFVFMLFGFLTVQITQHFISGSL